MQFEERLEAVKRYTVYNFLYFPSLIEAIIGWLLEVFSEMDNFYSISIYLKVILFVVVYLLCGKVLLMIRKGSCRFFMELSLERVSHCKRK